MAEIPEPLRKCGSAKAPVRIGAQSNSISSGQCGDVFDVIKAVVNGGRHSVAPEKSTKEIEPDDAVAGGDGLDLVVAQVPIIRAGDGGGVGVCGADRTGGSCQ